MEYYSQYGQDRYLDSCVFKGINNGVFIEVGAFNGIGFSNSYFFEKERNWTGICVEPIPVLFETLKNNRKCECIQACISSINGERDFLNITGNAQMLSGIIDNYDKRHVSRINNEIMSEGGHKEIIKVKTISINNLLNERNINHVDYISIDTEGSEMDVLKSIDFNNVSIKCISVEINYESNDIDNFMTSKGYKLNTKLVCDSIYVKY